MIVNEYYGRATDNRNRLLIDISCDVCNTVVTRQKRYLRDIDNKHWCSREHMMVLKGNRILFTCNHCRKEFYRAKSSSKNSKSGKYFCTRECKDIAQKYMKEIQPTHYGTGIRNYRNKALNNLPNKCNKCGYNKTIIALEVHHKDKNRNNNLLSNLEILCANCHRIEHKPLKPLSG